MLMVVESSSSSLVKIGAKSIIILDQLISIYLNAVMSSKSIIKLKYEQFYNKFVHVT